MVIQNGYPKTGTNLFNFTINSGCYIQMCFSKLNLSDIKTALQAFQSWPAVGPACWPSQVPTSSDRNYISFDPKADPGNGNGVIQNEEFFCIIF